jgi:hypothetical protein
MPFSLNLEPPSENTNDDVHSVSSTSDRASFYDELRMLAVQTRDNG